MIKKEIKTYQQDIKELEKNINIIKQPVKKHVKKIDTTSYKHSLLSFLSKKPV